MSTEVLRNLADLSRSLDEAVSRLADLELAAVEAEGRFKVSRARAFLNAEGSVQAREAQATVATETERAEYETAAALVRVHMQHIKALHTRIDVGRTFTATERALSGVAS